jgi:hypothetical protein
MIGYKGFDKDLKSRGFQYELGKTYTHSGTVDLYNSGFPFCENPFDVWSYYGPTNRFAQVEADGVSDQTESDSKRAAKSLHIGEELTLPRFINAGVKFILDKVDFKNAKESNTGYQSAATNTGDWSAATNTGNWSAATNTGTEGYAASLGIEGKASGSLGNWITLAEWKQDEKYIWHRIFVKTEKVDGIKIKPNVFYALKNGEFEEVV